MIPTGTYVVVTGLPSVTDAPRSPALPSAGADRAERDGSPKFASQIDAAKALRDRLDRDRVTHTRDDDA
jgi:hypothetical protein